MFRMIFMIFFFLLCFGVYVYISLTLIQNVILNKNGDKTLFGEITVV